LGHARDQTSTTICKTLPTLGRDLRMLKPTGHTILHYTRRGRTKVFSHLLSSPFLSFPLLSSSVLFCSVVLFCSLFVCFFCLLFYFIFVSRCLFLCLFLFVSFFNYILFSFSLLFSSLGLHPQLTVVPMYNNVPNTALQTRINSEFSALRATNEWDVGRPTTMFKYLDYRKVLFKDLQPIGMMTRSVCIITNCFNILDANATSEFYDCVPPSTLGHYLV